MVTKQAEMYQQLQQIVDALLISANETPLSRAIKSLCRLQFNDPLTLINPANEERLLLMQINWIIGLHWVLQKQSKELRKIQMPFNHPHFESREPFGAWLNAELALWDACFDFADTFDSPEAIEYPSITDAWFATTLERIKNDWNHSQLNQRKRDRLELLNEEVKLLASQQNPFESLPGQQERFNLISLAIAIATPNKKDNNKLKQRRKCFREFSWEPYIDTRRKWAQRLSSEAFKATRLTNNKLEVVLGGRQAEILYPAPAKSFLKQPRKKTGSLTIGSL